MLQPHHSISFPEKDEEVDVGIDGWNELPDEYAFKYAPSEDVLKTKPMRVLVKCLVIGEYLTVDAVEATAGVNGVVHNVEIRSDHSHSDHPSTLCNGYQSESMHAPLTVLQSCRVRCVRVRCQLQSGVHKPEGAPGGVGVRCVAPSEQEECRLRGGSSCVLVSIPSPHPPPLSPCVLCPVCGVGRTLKPVGGGRRPGSTLEDSRQPAR